MKIYYWVIVVSIFCVLIINSAMPQQDKTLQIKFAKPDFVQVLPKTHAELRLSNEFLKYWSLSKPDVSTPKSLTFQLKSEPQAQTKLKIHDYKESDSDVVKTRIKNTYRNSPLKLMNERDLTLDDRKINSLIYQDAKQNVRAYFVFKEEDAVFAIEIQSVYEKYADIYQYTYEIFGSIEVSDKIDSEFDKILVSSRCSILIPTSFEYMLPVKSSIFNAQSDKVKMQSYCCETGKSSQKIANDIELRLVESLGFKRLTGKITLRDNVEVTMLEGVIADNRFLRMYVLSQDEFCTVFIFEYEKQKDSVLLMQKIVESAEFSIQTNQPVTMLPFANFYDTDSDGNLDYFTINIIFLNANKEVINHRFKKGKLTVKITDENQRIAFNSAVFEVDSPKDCIEGGFCAEKLRFEGLWNSKVLNERYKISINLGYDENSINYKGKMTDMIID